MLDTRCYACATKFNTFVRYEHQVKGIFKCPRCGDILDLSKDTYTIKILRFYDIYGELETKILKLDPKFKADGKDIFEQDMYEMDMFDNIPVGKYELEVLWYYYKCGDMYGEEWDIEMEILSEEEIK